MRRKKGFILTLDVTIGLIITTTLLFVSSYYINQAKGPTLSKIQTVKRGSDILLQMDYLNSLDSLDINLIENNLTELKPANQRITLNLSGSNFADFSAGDVIPSNINLASGRMIFVLSGDDGSGNKIIRGYYTVRYSTWVR